MYVCHEALLPRARFDEEAPASMLLFYKNCTPVTLTTSTLKEIGFLILDTALKTLEDLKAPRHKVHFLFI